MTNEEFDIFLDNHPRVNWQWVQCDGKSCEQVEGPDDGNAMAFSVRGFPYYDEGGVTTISFDTLKELPVSQLYSELVKGCDVEQITRITGYFTKVSGWNRGKIEELRDRTRGMEMSGGFPNTQPGIGKCRN